MKTKTRGVRLPFDLMEAAVKKCGDESFSAYIKRLIEQDVAVPITVSPGNLWNKIEKHVEDNRPKYSPKGRPRFVDLDFYEDVKL